MIHLPVKQGSPEWFAARRGIPTASRFDSLITPRTRKESASSTKYLCQLVAERVFGPVLGDVSTGWMERGTELEARAVSAYEFEREFETTVAGFCLEDQKRWGCSPDRLVGEDGGLQIKCVNAADHIRALLYPDSMAIDHWPQCHGEMLVTGRRWWDLMFYNPALPSRIIRIEWDDEFGTALYKILEDFTTRLWAAELQLREEFGVSEGADLGMRPLEHTAVSGTPQ